MVPPIRCYTCGTVVGSAYAQFDMDADKGTCAKQCLDELGLTRICCRRMLISHPRSLDTMCLAHDEHMSDTSAMVHTVVDGSRTITLPVREPCAADVVQVAHPFRGNPNAILYRFRTKDVDPAVACRQAEQHPEVRMAWSEAPHPLSQTVDLMITFASPLTDVCKVTLFVCECLQQVRADVTRVVQTMRHEPANEQEPQRGSAIMPDGSYYMANCMRRISLSMIRAWAVKSVTIRSNTSVYPDDTVASRLSLVPFRIESDEQTCQLNIDVSNVHPVKNTTLYSSDLKMPAGASIGCCDPNIPLLRLKPGQRFSAVLTLDQSDARAHGRYGCVVEAGYVERCECISDSAELRKVASAGQMDMLTRALGPNVSYNAKCGELQWNPEHPMFEPTVTMEHSTHWLAVERRFRVTADRPLFKLHADPSWIHLFVETDGRVDGDEVLRQTHCVLQQTLDELLLLMQDHLLL